MMLISAWSKMRKSMRLNYGNGFPTGLLLHSVVVFHPFPTKRLETGMGLTPAQPSPMLLLDSQSDLNSSTQLLSTWIISPTTHLCPLCLRSLHTLCLQTVTCASPVCLEGLSPLSLAKPTAVFRFLFKLCFFKKAFCDLASK